MKRLAPATADSSVLELSVLDAFIAGLTTAFFGALVAGGAYLLRQQIIMREEVSALRNRLNELRRIEVAALSMGSQPKGNLEALDKQEGG